MKKQKANSLENITWSELGKQNIQGKKVYYYQALSLVLITQSKTFPLVFLLDPKSTTCLPSWRQFIVYLLSWRKVQRSKRMQTRREMDRLLLSMYALNKPQSVNVACIFLDSEILRAKMALISRCANSASTMLIFV